MVRFNKGLSLTVLVIAMVLCPADVAFCLRPPSHFSKSTESFVKNRRIREQNSDSLSKAISLIAKAGGVFIGIQYDYEDKPTLLFKQPDSESTIGLYEKDITLRRVSYELAKKRVEFGLASDEDFIVLLEDVIKRDRFGMVSYFEKLYYNPLSANALDGSCGESRSDVYEMLKFLINNSDKVKVRMYQAESLFNGHIHAFNVISYGGRDYLVDVTFIQYFNPLIESAKVDGKTLLYPWAVLKGSLNDAWVKMAHELLKNGYIELTDEAAYMYGNLLRGVLSNDFPGFNKDSILKAATAEYYYDKESLEIMFGDLEQRAHYVFNEKDELKINYYINIALQTISMSSVANKMPSVVIQRSL
jgi:hypothetical protein